MTMVKARPRRWLRLTSPRMSGDDVRRLQVGINSRLRARSRSPIEVDGVYGQATRDALRTVLWLLGCPSSKLDAGATTQHQRIVRDPSQRPNDWLPIARDRAKWLAKRHQERAEFLRWCRSKVGIKEQPPSSNRGPQIDAWQRECGFLGSFWCAMFLVFGLRHVAGFAAPSSWAYTPNILADARAGRYGTRFHPPTATPQPGWLVLFDFGYSSDPVEHVGVVDEKGTGTYEGNTSDDDKGNQANGGMVAHRGDRVTGRFVVGYVEIPYGA